MWGEQLYKDILYYKFSFLSWSKLIFKCRQALGAACWILFIKYLWHLEENNTLGDRQCFPKQPNYIFFLLWLLQKILPSLCLAGQYFKNSEMTVTHPKWKAFPLALQHWRLSTAPQIFSEFIEAHRLTINTFNSDPAVHVWTLVYEINQSKWRYLMVVTEALWTADRDHYEKATRKTWIQSLKIIYNVSLSLLSPQCNSE